MSLPAFQRSQLNSHPFHACPLLSSANPHANKRKPGITKNSVGLRPPYIRLFHTVLLLALHRSQAHIRNLCQAVMRYDVRAWGSLSMSNRIKDFQRSAVLLPPRDRSKALFRSFPSKNEAIAEHDMRYAI